MATDDEREANLAPQDATTDRTLSVTSLQALVANLPLAAAVAATHLSRNPWQAVWVGARALPAPARGCLAATLKTGATSVIAAAAAGRRELARQRLTAGLGVATPRGRRRHLAAAAAVGEWATAQTVTTAEGLASLGGGSAAYVAYAAGDVNVAQHALRDARNPLSHSHRRWLHGQRAVLTGRALDALDRARRGPRTVTPIRPSGETRPPSVLHVVTNALPEVQAGYTIRTQGILAAQRVSGIDAHVATPPGFPVTQGHLRAAAEVVVDGVPYHRHLPRDPRELGLGRPDDTLEAYAAHLHEWARDHGVDLLHVHSGHVNAQAALVAGERLGVPVVYEVRGFLEETWRSRGGRRDSDFHRWTRETETRCMDLASAVVTLSESMRADIVARGVDPGSVQVVGNCVPDAYLTDPVDAVRTRALLGIPETAVVVGSVSTVNGYEGLDLLVEAAGLLDDPDLVVLVVGNGPEHDRLARRADELRARGMRSRVILHGRVPHGAAREFHAALDVFCAPRRATPVTELVPPLKPVEAMALGRPVVASDLPPLRELVGADRGVLVPPGDAGALAGALASLAGDPDGRARLGTRAREHVAAHRTWSAAAAAYRDIYDTVLGTPAPVRRRGRQEAS